MAMEVDLVVLSDAPKELEAGVRVVVGLPSRNPWFSAVRAQAVFCGECRAI